MYSLRLHKTPEVVTILPFLLSFFPNIFHFLFLPFYFLLAYSSLMLSFGTYALLSSLFFYLISFATLRCFRPGDNDPISAPIRNFYSTHRLLQAVPSPAHFPMMSGIPKSTCVAERFLERVSSAPNRKGIT